mgnify:CR=1 FL=1
MGFCIRVSGYVSNQDPYKGSCRPPQNDTCIPPYTEAPLSPVSSIHHITMRTILVSVAVCLAVLCHQAAAQTCPTKICNAAFTNPLNGGPEDCCKWDYNKGPCQM